MQQKPPGVFLKKSWIKFWNAVLIDKEVQGCSKQKNTLTFNVPIPDKIKKLR